ncbi:hypothetical protein BJV74DRAFT_4403 [Russula compacta]|nr:hypothetical protein BJV74DRAFT_4403 [Russula compacta]
MSKPTRNRPLPPIPPTHAHNSEGLRSLSLDVGEGSSSSSSTPSTSSLSDDCQPFEGVCSLQSSISLPIMPATIHVKFAPLPEIGPRIRRPNQQALGVAARSRMLQQKREIRMQAIQRHPRPWSDLDGRRVVFTPVEEREDDPLEVLGKFIADKSKSLWSEIARDEEERQAASVQSRPPNREVPLSSDPPNQTGEISINNSGRMVKASLQEDSAQG